MKKLIYLLICTVFVFASCSDDNDNYYETFPVTVQLSYPADYTYTATEGVLVKLQNSSGSGAYEGRTDATGKAVVNVPSGVYNIVINDSRLISSKRVNFNGATTGVVVNNSTAGNLAQEVDLQLSQSALVVIKELYVGGCQKDDGSGAFIYDRYVVLHNNSDENVNIGKMGLATAMPYNSTGTNHYYQNGKLSYSDKGWIPAGQAVWYFQKDVIMAPGQDLVIALANAVNNTITYSKSINFDNSEYYCTYDNEVMTHVKTYPAPSASIPTDHYLKAVAYGLGTAWPLSTVCPTFYLFTPVGTTVKDFAKDVSNYDSYNGNTNMPSAKVPVDWITDGVEVFTTSYDGNQKRLTPAIDGGAVYLTNSEGYSIYRNVDKEATEAIISNKGKLLYNYSFGTINIGNGSTDPSGIDAEASVRNGARIIYKDTNNSTEDFHQRSRASLRK